MINKKIKNKLLYFLKYILIYFVLLIISVSIIYIVDAYVIKKMGYNSIIYQISNTNKKVNKLSFLTVALVVPLLEEVSFRLFLIPTRFKVLLSSITLSFFIIYGTFIKIDVNSIHFVMSCLYTFIIAIIVYYKYSKIEKIIINKNKIISFVSILIFGLFHITNIKDLHIELALLYPIYVLPQISLGYVLTKIRLENGFVWGFILHFLINSITFL